MIFLVVSKVPARRVATPIRNCVTTPPSTKKFWKHNIELRTRPESEPRRQYCANTILPLSRRRFGGVLQRFVILSPFSNLSLYENTPKLSPPLLLLGLKARSLKTCTSHFLKRIRPHESGVFRFNQATESHYNSSRIRALLQ